MSTVMIEVLPPGGTWGADSTDITGWCLFERCSFTSQFNGVPGSFDIAARDENSELSFTTGMEIRLTVDGVVLFGGYITTIGMTFLAPAVSNADEASVRNWHLTGPDYNIVFDKRFFRNTADYFQYITVNSAVDGVVLRTALGSYADMADFDTTSQIADIVTQPDTTHIVIQQGWPVRKEFETLLQFSGAVYYASPEKVIVWQPYEQVVKRWGFSDSPNHNAITSSPAAFQGSYWGFSSVEATEDGTQMANDIFMWGGAAFSETGKTVVARRQDATTSHSSGSGYWIDNGSVVGGSSIDVHGRWQYAEQHFSDVQYATVNQVKMAAENMLLGSVGGDIGTAKGLRNPQWQFTFQWNSDQVPTLGGVPDHVIAGDLVTVNLSVFGVTRLLPLRQVTISFPDAFDGEPPLDRLVHFEGVFGLQLSDSYTLWRYIRQQQSKPTPAPVVAVVSDSSASTTYGAFYSGVPTPAPDGSTVMFTIHFGYIPGTLAVYYDGALQRLGTDFTETDNVAGTFTMAVAPVTGHRLDATSYTLAS